MSCVQASAGLAAARFLDGAILHDVRSGKLFRLNGAATAVWEALRRGAAQGSIVRALVRRHDVEPDRARTDVAAFVATLRRSGLLREPVGAGRRQKIQSPLAPKAPPAFEAVYGIGDLRVAVSCHSPRVAAGFAPLAAPALAPGDATPDIRIALHFSRGAFHITRDGRAMASFPTAPAARWGLVRELVGCAGGPWLALLHAAAVATPAGCLLLCGSSGRGKSTLLAGLVHAGARFMADDVAPLQSNGKLVWPTPLAISVKHGSWRAVGRLFPQLADAPIVRFGGRTMRYLWPSADAVAEHAGRPVAAALFPVHSPGAAATLEPLDAVQALVQLGEGGSVLPASDAALAEFLAWWMEVPAYRLTYGRLGDAVALAADLASAPRSDAPRPAA